MNAKNDNWGVLPLIVGLGMAFTVSIAGMVVYLIDGIGSFPEIMYACVCNGINIDQCNVETYKAGLYSVIVHGVYLFLLVGLAIFLAHKKPLLSYNISGEAKRILIFVVLLIVSIHVVLTITMLPVSSRIEDIRRFSTFISLENLFWPLLLHLYVMEKDSVDSQLLLSALIVIVMLSPYRTAGATVAIFGFLLPLMVDSWDSVRSGKFMINFNSWLKKVAFVLLVTLCITLQVANDTATRNASVLLLKDIPVEFDDEVLVPKSYKPRLHQRLLYPLVQAGIVRYLADKIILPGPREEIERKFRLSSKENLNEFIYRRIYGGNGIGETNSLVYGEASAYFHKFAVLWLMFVPASIIAIWYFLRRKGIQISTIAGVALWRSSFAGLITVAPGLILQLLMYFSLIVFKKRLRLKDRVKLFWNRTALLSIAGVLIVLAIAQTGLMLGFVLSEGSVEATLAPIVSKECKFNRANIERALEEKLDNQFRYYITFQTENLLSVGVPGGKGEDQRLSKVSAVINETVECSKDRKAIDKITTIKKVSIKARINLIHFLALIIILLTMIKTFKEIFPGFSFFGGLGGRHDSR